VFDEDLLMNVSELFVMHLSSGETTVISRGKSERQPSWSPEGTMLVWADERNRNMDIFLANADGSDIQPLTDSAAHDSDPAWRP
jgi:Tol biopolymer transport system component